MIQHPLPVPVHRALHAAVSGPAPAAKLPGVTELCLTASDGFPLAASLHENKAADGPLLLVSPATAVSRRFYDRFARAACAAGFRAVLTYDYRGIAGSRAPSCWKTRLDMCDWWRRDLPAAARALRGIDPDAPMVAIGQSIGGLALAMSGMHPAFARHAMIAAGHGWRGHTDEAWKLMAWMDLVALPVAAIAGHAPAWLGLGQSVPFTILADWAHFTRRRDYVFNDPALPETARIAAAGTPALALGFSDDPWTTRRAMDAMIGKFASAPVERHFLSPASLGLARIGHMGFFRAEAGTALWRPVLEWLSTGAPPEFGAAGSG
ncbi:hypothetical protein ACLB6G_16365 [Zhengella sp. ZM62]|uniref:alpha/beta hydrolase family protein n=1 Tax=Zhengella sedimenti TaxID=3390035 RepID=UPI003974F8C6